LLKLEAEGGLRRKNDFFVAGESASRSPGTCARCSADGCASAASGESPEQGAEASAASGQRSAPLAFSLDGTNQGNSFDGFIDPVDAQRCKPELQARTSGDVAERFGVDDRSGSRCAGGNGGLPIDFDGARQSGGERLTRLADLRAYRLSQSHRQFGAGGNEQRPRRRRRGFRRTRGVGGLVELVSPEPFAPVGLLLQPGRAKDR